MNDQIIWMLAGVGLLILGLALLWLLSCFIDWLHSVAMEWRSKSFSAGEDSAKHRLITASTWFHDDPATAELIRDLAVGRHSVGFIRDEYMRRKANP